MPGMRRSDRILITGGTGLIGTNLHQRLLAKGYDAIAVGSDRDLRDPTIARRVFDQYQPSCVYHLAARVGGIFANSHFKAAFYSDNVLINTHVVNECARREVRYVFAMGTGCAYPKRLEGGLLKEDSFLDGVPEVTNDAYAYAKRGLLVHLSSLRDCGALEFCYCLPANIYGPYDNFHPTHSHVVPGLIRRFVEAASSGVNRVSIWGDGSAKRDFLYIDDCIDAMELLACCGFSGPVNVATGHLTRIMDLAHEIRTASGFSGVIDCDKSYPAGQSERLFDTSKMATLGWKPKIGLEEGIRKTVAWFAASRATARER